MAADVHPTVLKWRSWIEGPIREDIVGMIFRRMMWREIAGMMEANPAVGELPSVFWDFYQQTYSATQTIAIRRQDDRNPCTCSLAVLITEMRDNPELLIREHYVDLLGDRKDGDLLEQRANRDFTGLAGGGDQLDPNVAEKDLAALHSAAEKVRQYVNQHVAHDQAEPTMTDLPTFGDLHDAIDGIGEIFQKYAVMLTGGWNLLEPVIQDDWKAIFRVPWIPPET